MQVKNCIGLAGLVGVLIGVLGTSSRGFGAMVLTDATLFRADATGSNLNTVGGKLARGGWTSVLDQQNVPGNYGGEFFLSQTPTPSASDFLSPSASLSLPLNVGANTFYFFADGDDTAGGAAGFGLNLFFNSAATTSPSASAFAPPGIGQTVVPNTSLSTAGYDFLIVPGAGTLSYTSGNLSVSLTSYQITAVGGASGNSTVDLVNSTNTSPFTPPPHSDGVMDTYGQFTLTVTSVPEPSTVAVLGVASMAIMARRKNKNGKASN